MGFFVTMEEQGLSTRDPRRDSCFVLFCFAVGKPSTIERDFCCLSSFVRGMNVLFQSGKGRDRCCPDPTHRDPSSGLGKNGVGSLDSGGTTLEDHPDVTPTYSGPETKGRRLDVPSTSLPLSVPQIQSRRCCVC